MIKFTATVKEGTVTLENGKIEGKPWEIATDINLLVRGIIGATKESEVLHGFLKEEFHWVYDIEKKSKDELKDLLERLKESLKELEGDDEE